jgi:thioesterase domain-containing protein
LVRASEPVPGLPADRAWGSSWDSPHDSADVPGDHVSMMGEHAGTTARAVESWLSTSIQPTAQPLRG